MPRAPRVDIPGAMHHVTARAPKGLQLFKSREDRLVYLDLLAEQVRLRKWSLRTYCLMGNHVHLLPVTTEADLSEGIKAVHETFVREMHHRYETYGPLLRDFKSRVVTSTDYELACLRYIARNPVKDGFCESPEDWEWSAHNALAGLVAPPRFLDVERVRCAIDQRSYLQLTATSDQDVLTQLEQRAPTTWLVDAVDHHAIPIPTIAAHLGVSRSTAYERIAALRTEGLSP